MGSEIVLQSTFKGISPKDFRNKSTLAYTCLVLDKISGNKFFQTVALLFYYTSISGLSLKFPNFLFSTQTNQ